MSVRVKTKRRLMYLATAGVLVAALGGGAYVFRSRYIAAQLVQSRAEGVEALKSGNYEVALHKIGRYVQRNGNDADALYQYALAREQVPEANGRHIGQAIAVYRQLLSLDPSRLEARRRLLGLYVDYGFNQEAVDTADAIMSVDAKAQASAEDRRAALRGKARALARQRKFDKALDALNEFGKLSPSDLEMQRLALEVMLARGDAATDAVERAQRLLGEHPDDARFELLLGIAFRMAEARGDGAPGASSPARRWVTAAAAHPLVNDPAFVAILVEQLEGLELFEDSLRVLAQSSGTGAAGAAENHRLYVARLWQAGKYAEVEARLKDLNPADKASDSELLALRAVALRELKRPAEAAPIVEALGRRFDPSAEGWAPVLKTLFASDAAGNSAAADAPANRDVLRACSDAVGRAPRNPYFRYFLGNAFSAAGEQELALLHWRHAIQLAPAWAAPRLKLAELGLAAGMPAEAVDFALAARARAPEDPEVAVALANALAASLARQDAAGDVAARDRAAQQLRDEVARVERLSPGHESTLVLTTILNAATGHREQAVVSARAALDPARTLRDTTYLRLGAISAAYHLGVEDELYTRCEKAVGRLTPALAAYEARAAVAAGKTEEARKLLESARASAQGRAEVRQLRIATAGFLDAVNDPAAKAAWSSLATDAADDAGVQLLALRSPSVQKDRAFLEQTIERLRVATIDHAVNWRLARARWMLDGAAEGDSQTVARAATLLGDVSRDFPELADARLLLARCMVRLGNPWEAIEQLNAVVANRPQLLSASLELANMLQGQGDFAGARPHLDRVLDDPSATAKDLLAAAGLLARGGDVRQALAASQKAAGADTAKGVQSVLLAELYRLQGDTQKAKEVCQKLLEKTADPAVVALLADVLADEGDPAGAERVLARLDASAKSPQKELVRGRHYAAHGEPRKALEQFAAATESAPASPAGWRLLARQHLALGATGEAVAVAARASANPALPPQDRSGFDALRRCAGLAGTRPADAVLPLLAYVVDNPADERAVADVVRCYAPAATGAGADAAPLAARLRDVARKYPGCLPVQTLAARVCASWGGTWAEEGVSIATAAMQAFPTAPEPAQAATLALEALGRPQEALGFARQWKQRAAGAAAPDLAAARLYIALHNPQEAINQVKPYVPADGATAPEATLLYAQSLCLLGNVAEAEKLLSGRLATSTQARVGWMALAAGSVADDAVAARWLEKVEGETPPASVAERATLAQAWLALSARLESQSKDPAAARARAARVVAGIAGVTLSAPQASAGDLVAVGMLCESVGDVKSAEAAYKRALALNAGNPVALNNLAMMLASRGEAAAAEPLAAAAVRQEHPNRASFFDTLAMVQSKLKRWGEASTSIQRARELAPDNIGYQIHQAAIFVGAGDRAKAQSAFEKVSDLRPEDRKLSETDRERLRLLKKEFASI